MTAQGTGCAEACWDQSTEKRDAVIVILVQGTGRAEAGLDQSTVGNRDVVIGVTAQEIADVVFD